MYNSYAAAAMNNEQPTAEVLSSLKAYRVQRAQRKAVKYPGLVVSVRPDDIETNNADALGTRLGDHSNESNVCEYRLHHSYNVHCQFHDHLLII